MKTNFGIGVDIERIDRFEDLANGRKKRLLDKIFTSNEIQYCFSKTNAAPHLAVRYAGKEAVIKAVSSTFGCNLGYNEIEIINNKEGIPNVMIKKEGFQNIPITISMSHNTDFAIAFTVIDQRKIGV